VANLSDVKEGRWLAILNIDTPCNRAYYINNIICGKLWNSITIIDMEKRKSSKRPPFLSIAGVPCFFAGVVIWVSLSFSILEDPWKEILSWQAEKSRQ